MFDQRGELPLLPFGYPIGPSTLLRMVSLLFEGLRAMSLSNRSNHFVRASRGGVYIESPAHMAPKKENIDREY